MLFNSRPARITPLLEKPINVCIVGKLRPVKKETTDDNILSCLCDHLGCTKVLKDWKVALRMQVHGITYTSQCYQKAHKTISHAVYLSNNSLFSIVKYFVNLPKKFAYAFGEAIDEEDGNPLFCHGNDYHPLRSKCIRHLTVVKPAR